MKLFIYLRFFIILLMANGCKNNIDENTPQTKWAVIPLSENYSGFSKILFLDTLNGCLIGGYGLDSFGHINATINTTTKDGGRTWNFPLLDIPNYVAGFRNICKTPNGILYASANSGVIYTQAIKTLFTSKYVNNGFNLKKVQLGLGCPLQFNSN